MTCGRNSWQPRSGQNYLLVNLLFYELPRRILAKLYRKVASSTELIRSGQLLIVCGFAIFRKMFKLHSMGQFLKENVLYVGLHFFEFSANVSDQIIFLDFKI